MEKWKLSSLLLLNLALPQAANAWTTNWLLEGSWLVGISAGWAERDGDINTVIYHPAPGLQITNYPTPSNRSFDSGKLWGLLVGYEVACNNWILGVEANMDWQDKVKRGDDNILPFTDALNQGWVYAPHYQNNAVIGLTGRIAYQVFTYFVPYIRLGAEFSDNKLSYSANDPVIPRNFVYADGRRHMTRFLAGAGVEVPLPNIMEGLSLRGEYNYHSHGTTVEVRGLANDIATLWVVDARVSTHSGKASIVWNLPL